MLRSALRNRGSELRGHPTHVSSLLCLSRISTWKRIVKHHFVAFLLNLPLVDLSREQSTKGLDVRGLRPLRALFLQ